MFLIDDTLTGRQKKIRSYEPFVGVVLAAADFEWTVRRGILALGVSPTKEIRDGVLKRCSGLEQYKIAWNKEAKLLTGKALTEVIPDWGYFKNKAFPLRHRLVHGVDGSVTKQYASERIESILSASKAIVDLAVTHDEPIYGRQIRRIKRREL